MQLEILDKFLEMEKKISSQKGEFHLFGLFLREDAPEVWDVLISAPWINGDKKNALKFLSSRMQKTLNEDELKRISRIVIIEKGNPALRSLQQSVHVEHSKIEIRNSSFSGLPIKHAFLITCKVGTDAKDRS